MRRNLIYLSLISLFIILCSYYYNEKSSNSNPKEALSDQLLNLRGVSSEEQTTLPKKTELEQIGPIGVIKRSYNDIKSKYPDKTILTVWGICPSDYVTDCLNEYLVKNGTDYVIYFKERTANEALMDIPKTKGQQVDTRKELLYELIDTADIMAVEREHFHDMVDDGCFLPWNDYLTTEDGKKLYQLLPKNNWKSVKIDGQIFGINGRSDYVYGPPSYLVNKVLMKKYNITKDDLNKPIYKLKEILTKVAEGEKANTNFNIIRVDTGNIFSLQNVSSTYLNGAMAVMLYNDPKKDAGILLEDPEYLKWLKTMNQYANKGWLGTKNQQLETFFLEIDMSSTLPYTNPSYGYYYNAAGELADTKDLTEIVLKDYYQGSLSWNNQGAYANCIPKKSLHPEEAFDFLAKAYSDTYITNLLLYGVETKNYQMEDGKVAWPVVQVNDAYIGNSYLSYPRFFEYPDKNDKYKRLQKSYPYVYYNFYFDSSKVQEEIKETNKVMRQLTEIISGNVQDFDAFIEDLRKQLNNKGVQTLKEEANRQKSIWLAEASDE